MEHRLYLAICLLLTISCSKPNSANVSEETTADTVAVREEASDPVPDWSLEQYKATLSDLSKEPEAVMQALDYFKLNAVPEDSATNDQALKAFMDFQKQLLEALNNKLMESADYEDINTLAYDDSTQYTPRAFEFQKRMTENGLLIVFAEGMVFIDSDPRVIKDYFNPYVTSGAKAYLSLYAREILQPSSADAGIIISSGEFADRLAAWDRFIQVNPNSVFLQDARQQLKYYRYFFLVGMDNTPAFDYESNKMNDESLGSLQYFLEKYPDVPSAATVRNYLDLLKKSDYVKTEAVDEFTSKYSPYN